MSDLLGRHIGNYTITGMIGQGGMAHVYRAQPHGLQREVAIKVIRLDRTVADDFLKRFNREIKLITSLNHPNILKVYDSGVQQDLCYLVMELLPGGHLEKLIAQHAPLPPAHIEKFLSQIGAALSHAHERGIVHRDLKPSNIMLNAAGDAILTDFGIAKALDDSTRMTRTNIILGSPAYMSPEQWRGEGVDQRTDVYALGVIYFEMLTGQLPFNATELAQMMHQHMYTTPPSVRTIVEGIPDKIAWIADKALMKAPTSRFASVAEMVTAFKVAFRSVGEWQPAQTSPSTPQAATNPAAPTTASSVPTRNLRRAQNIGDETATVVMPPMPDADTRIAPEKAVRQEAAALRQLEAEMADRAARVGTASRLINPLPQDVNAKFKGRQKEQADASRLLAEGARLVSIYGRAGVGKTALACKVIEDLRAASEPPFDGVVCLSAITTGVTLDRLFADASKLMTEAHRATFEAAWRDSKLSTAHKITALVEAFHSERILILLDNLETLQNPESGALTDADLQTFIELVLRLGGPIHLLATSREPLAIPPELKPKERLLALEEGLLAADGIDLLRASDPDGAAGLRDAPDGTLVKLVGKVRGLPRALEALVGLLLSDSLLTVDELLTSTDDARDGPAASADGPPTQATSQAPGKLVDITMQLIQQSVARLPAEAVRVLESLAVYERPVPQAALGYMLAPHADLSSLRALLNRLVKTYLISFNRAADTFVLHPIDREYHYGRIPAGTLGTPGGVAATTAAQGATYDRRALNQRAADFFRHQATPVDSWTTLEQAYPRLAEMDYRLRAGDHYAAASIILEVHPLLFRWGYFDLSLQRLQSLDVAGLLPPVRGRLHLYSGQVERVLGRVESAEAYMHRALEAATASADQSLKAECLVGLSGIARFYQHYQEAADHAQAAYHLYAALQNRNGEGIALNQMAICAEGLGSVPLAIEHYEQAAALFEMTHDSNNLARAYGNLAGLLGTQGKLDRAFDYYERSNVHFRAVGDRRGEALNMINMGADQLSLYQFDAALTVYQQSLAICREINDPGLALFSLNGIASIYQSLGVYDKALAFFGESLSLSRMVKDVYTEVGNLGNIGSVYVALGQYEAGIERLNAALALADPNNLDQEKHYKRTFLASALLFKGDLPGALDAIRQARAIDVPLNNANALQLEGVILARQGRFDLARAAFEQAITNCDQLLAEMPHFAAALFTRGGARAGLAICGMDAVPAALADMRAGKAVCSARGILEDAARSLGALMQCPNGETLRPLEALLLSAQD